MILLEIGLAYVYSHVLEYYAHKFLHRFKKKHQPLAFHLREHHAQAWRNNMHDTPSLREATLLGCIALMHSPLLLVSPPAFWTLVFCAMSYLYVHTRSHMDIKWAMNNVPWHVDHHLGNHKANWGVRKPWIDILLGTRVPK